MLPTPLPFSSFSISGMVATETEASGQEQLLGTGQLGLLGGPGRRVGLLLCVHPTPNAATCGVTSHVKPCSSTKVTEGGAMSERKPQDRNVGGQRGSHGSHDLSCPLEGRAPATQASRLQPWFDLHSSPETLN